MDFTNATDDEKQAAIQAYLERNQTLADNIPAPVDNEEIQAPDAVDEAPSPLPAAAPAADPAMDPRDEKIKAYLQQYNTANDDSDIQQARADSAHTNFVSNMGDAFETLAKSNSMAHGGAGVDTGFYQGLKAQGQQGVNQAIAQRQAKVDAFLKQHEIERQVAQDTMTRGTYDQAQKAAKIINDKNDPNSAVSKNAVLASQGTFNDFPGIEDIIKPGMTANEVAETLKGLEKKATLDSARTNREALVERKKEVDDEKKKQGDKSVAMKDFDELKKDLDSDLASSRTPIGQAQNKFYGAQRIMTFADTTPEELEKAKNDPKLAAQLKAKFDKLTPQQYGEVVNGLMAQITPGVGSFGQLEHLRSDTAEQRLANLKQYFTSHPQPAGMGDMILNNMMTLKNEQDTGKNVLIEHAGKMQAKHPHAFAHEATADLAKNLLSKYQGEPREVLGSTQQPQGIHPEASQAEKWAQDHPVDPRSAIILKRLGTVVGSN